MSERSKDWIRQARRDLEHANHDLESGFYEWGCFSAQQAAEKAVKGVFQHIHAEAWGHSVKKLLEKLKEFMEFPEELIEHGAVLDKFYIPARYPNGFEQGAPVDFFTKDEVKQAIGFAGKIIGFCESMVS